MKIDLNGPGASSLDNVTSTQHGQAPHSPVVGTEAHDSTEDNATLSSDSVGVKALTANAMTTSEIRQEKVEALRQAVQNGTYKIEPDKIAEAMIREFNRK